MGQAEKITHAHTYMMTGAKNISLFLCLCTTYLCCACVICHVTYERLRLLWQEVEKNRLLTT